MNSAAHESVEGETLPARNFYGPLLVWIVVAVTLRLFHLTQQNLWYDEIFCLHVAGKPLIDLIGACIADVHPPGFFLLLKLWQAVFGSSLTALRLLPVVLSLATCVLAYVLAYRLAGGAVAHLTLALLAVSPHQIYYAQEVRMYSLLMMATAATTLAWLEWTRSAFRNRRAMWWYVGMLLLALYTHYFAFLLLAGLVLHFLVISYRRGHLRWDSGGISQPVREWLIAHTVVFVGFVPWLPFLIEDAGTRQSWRKPMTLTETLSNDAKMYETMVIGSASDRWATRHPLSAHGSHVFPPTPRRRMLWATQFLARWILPVLLCCGLVVAIRAFLRRSDDQWLPAILALVPLFVASVMSMRQGLDVSRYLLFTTPFLFMLAAQGLMVIPFRLVHLAAGVMCVAAMLIGTFDYYAIPSRQNDLRPILAHVARHLRPGDRIGIVPDYLDICLEFYARRAGLTDEVITADHTSEADGHLVWARDRENLDRAWMIIDFRSGLFREEVDTGPFRIHTEEEFGYRWPRARLLELVRDTSAARSADAADPESDGADE